MNRLAVDSAFGYAAAAKPDCARRFPVVPPKLTRNRPHHFRRFT